MAEFKQVPIFTWDGKEYSVRVKSSVYDNWKDYFKDEKELYQALIEGLPKQKNDDGSQKYPELTPRPDVGSKEYRKLDKEWWNKRLTKGGRERMGDSPPSKTAIKDWEKNYPGAKKFFNSMVRYGQVQGLTYGTGEDIGLQGDIKAFKYFSNLYPGIAMGAEFTGAIPTGLGLSVGARKLAGTVASKLPFISGEALPQSAGFGERFVRFGRNIGWSGAEGLAHMFGWRAGHGTSPHATERLKEAAVGRNALLDYGLAGGGAALLPVAGRSVTALKNMFQNMRRRGGAEAGADELANIRLSESWLESIDDYAKMGIPEDVMWGALQKTAATEGMTMADAVAQTVRNIDNMILTGEAPALQALPISRDLSWAAGEAPTQASLRLVDRIADSKGINQRALQSLQATRGGLLTDPKTALNVTLEDYANRATDFYRELGRRSTKLDREAFRQFFKPKGKWEARAGTDRNVIDKAWDDTVEEINNILREGDAAIDDYATQYGRAPERLATRKEFIDNRYIRDSRDSKALIDSGEYARARDTSGKLLPRQPYVDDAGVTRYNHVLTKTNNTINPLHAQMIEQNMYNHLKYRNPNDTTSPALTSRQQAPIQAKIKEWNEAIGNEIPAYRIGNKLHNEKKLIEEAYEAGKAKGVADETSTGYDAFNDWLDNWKSIGGKDISDTAKNDAMRMFFSRSAMDFLPPNVMPEQILSDTVLQGRLARFIGNEDAYKKFMTGMLDEQAKLEVTRSFPAAQHQLAAKGTTSLEAHQAAPTFLEAAPSSAAMFAFSPAFFAGRRGAEFIKWARGLKNESVANSIVRRMMDEDLGVKSKFLQDLESGVGRLRSPIESGMGASYGAGPLAVQSWQGGEQYAVPERKRKKELEDFMRYRGLLR
jgi:hypothetical protein